MTQGKWGRRKSGHARSPVELQSADRRDAEANQRSADRARFVNNLQDHHEQMRGLALRVLRDPDAADDALQNAYIKAYQSHEGFRGESSFSTWLYTIVYRCCIDEHRRRKPTVPFDEAFGGDLALDASTPFEQTLGQRLGLRDALETLTPAQRAAVWLVDAEGMTFVAAADILGVPAGTVASRVSRARAALRQTLSDRPGEWQ